MTLVKNVSLNNLYGGQVTRYYTTPPSTGDEANYNFTFTYATTATPTLDYLTYSNMSYDGTTISLSGTSTTATANASQISAYNSACA